MGGQPELGHWSREGAPSASPSSAPPATSPRRRSSPRFSPCSTRIASQRFVTIFIQLWMVSAAQFGSRVALGFSQALLMQHFTVFGYARSKMNDEELRTMISTTQHAELTKGMFVLLLLYFNCYACSLAVQFFVCQTVSRVSIGLYELQIFAPTTPLVIFI